MVYAIGMDIITTIVLLTNAQRVAPLMLDAKLTRVAQARAEYICKDFSHDKFREQVVSKVTSSWVGENLAKDFNDGKTLVAAWVASPTHYANIVKKEYRKIGVARAKSCNAYVQVFSN